MYVFPTKSSRLEFFKAKLRTDPRWALRALLRIYAYQTEAEKVKQTTQEANGVGFSGMDGEILSKFAQQVLKWNAATKKPYPEPLSVKQQALVQRLVPRYAAQLLAHLDAAGDTAFIVVKGTPWVVVAA